MLGLLVRLLPGVDVRIVFRAAHHELAGGDVDHPGSVHGLPATACEEQGRDREGSMHGGRAYRAAKPTGKDRRLSAATAGGRARRPAPRLLRRRFAIPVRVLGGADERVGFVRACPALEADRLPLEQDRAAEELLQLAAESLLA